MTIPLLQLPTTLSQDASEIKHIQKQNPDFLLEQFHLHSKFKSQRLLTTELFKSLFYYTSKDSVFIGTDLGPLALNKSNKRFIFILPIPFDDETDVELYLMRIFFIWPVLYNQIKWIEYSFPVDVFLNIQSYAKNKSQIQFSLRARQIQNSFDALHVFYNKDKYTFTWSNIIKLDNRRKRCSLYQATIVDDDFVVVHKITQYTPNKICKHLKLYYIDES